MFCFKYLPKMMPKLNLPYCLQKLILVVILLQVFFKQYQCQLTPVTCGIKPPSCPDSPYRTYDGSCNNLKNPEWGMEQTRYGRLLPPNYGNGIDYPSVAKSGKPLPPARKVSSEVYPDVLILDQKYTLGVMQYGQIVVHDMSLTKDNNQIKQQTAECCSADGKLLRFSNDPEFCYPILVPNNDPDYSKYKIDCFEFLRTGTDREYGCGLPNKPIEQLTSVTHYLDLSIVYGPNEEVAKELRLFKEGKLKFDYRDGQEWIPRLDKNDTKFLCTLDNSKEFCYKAGDIRANQSPQLTILQTLLFREHNRVAEELGKLNPKWNDEKIFQEARKICIAEHQNIVYYELLPIYLGYDSLLKRKIIYKTKDFINDYNSSINPSVLNEHATAAFRFYHTSIAGHLKLVKEDRSKAGELRISDWFDRPAILEKERGNFDKLTRGLATQCQYAVDKYHDKEITNNWIRPLGKEIGQDLKSICIQRNRDHGLASYNNVRAYCGLPKAKKFEDFEDTISKDNVKKLKSLYESPDDVDLTVGGSLEKLVSNTLAGPTFLCILTEQFYRTRVGDRFFFENSGKTGFTLAQLNELRKATISRLICDNTDIDTIQAKGFEKISDSNPRNSCRRLPSVDLKLWKE